MAVPRGFRLYAAVALAAAAAGFAAWLAMSARAERMRIYIESTALGGAQPVPMSGMNYHPHFSSDSKRVVFAHRESSKDAETRLMVADVDEMATGFTPREAYHAPAVLLSPQWILGDTEIAFLRTWGDKENEIWAVNPKTGALRRILTGFGPIEMMKASPDGATLLFQTTGEKKVMLITIAAKGGEAPKGVYSFLEEKEIPVGFCWTNDSEKVIYLTRRGELVVVALDGREITRIPLPIYVLSGRGVFADPSNPLNVMVFGSTKVDGSDHLGIYSISDRVMRVNPKKRGKIERGHHMSPNQRFIVYSS